MEVNQEKREKFMQYAGKRVNNVLHDMQILEPMARSTSYDFTRQDVDEMFAAMQETLNNVKVEFEKKFEEKARSEKKVFSFGNATQLNNDVVNSSNIETIENVYISANATATTAVESSLEDTSHSSSTTTISAEDDTF